MTTILNSIYTSHLTTRNFSVITSSSIIYSRRRRRRRNFSVGRGIIFASQSGVVSKNIAPKFITLLLNSFNDPNNVFTNSEES